MDLLEFRNGVFFGLMLSVSAGGVGWMIKLCYQVWNTLIGGK